MKIIALAGAYRCGKTYLAHRLVDSLPNSYHVAFADYLKTLTVELYPDKIDDIYAPTKSPETRALLGKVSNKMKQEHGINYFIDKTLEDVPSDLDYLIISDCRFKIEIDYVSKLNHTFIFLGENDGAYAFDYLLENYEVLHLPAKPSLQSVHNILLK